MIGIKVRVKGLKEFIRATDNVIKALDSGVFTERIRLKTKRRAKYVAPRKTGDLVRSIDAVKVSQHSFKLISDARSADGTDYGAILELGLSRFIPIGTPSQPRIIRSPHSRGTGKGRKRAYLPFLRWALWRTLQEKDTIFKQEVLKYYK